MERTLTKESGDTGFAVPPAVVPLVAAAAMATADRSPMVSLNTWTVPLSEDTASHSGVSAREKARL